MSSRAHVCCTATGPPQGSSQSVLPPGCHVNQKTAQKLQYYKSSIYSFTFVCEDGTCAHGCADTREEARGRTGTPCSPPYPLGQGLYNERGVNWRHQAPVTLPSLFPTALGYRGMVGQPDFLRGCWGSELGLSRLLSQHRSLPSCLSSPTLG